MHSCRAALAVATVLLTGIRLPCIMAAAVAPPREADVVVYGATATGLAAAIQVTRMGQSAVVIEASPHVGGMTTGGLSSSDVGKAWSIGGLREECTNLLVPTCVSASHAAYGSLRMEPVYMELGQAAGTAAAFAIEAGTDVQDVAYAKLRERLLADGAKLSPDDAPAPRPNGKADDNPQPMKLDALVP